MKHIDQLPRIIGLTSRSKPIQVPQALRDKTRIIDIDCDLRDPWEFNFSASHIVHLAADGSESAYSKEAGKMFIAMAKNLENWSMKQNNPIVFHASSGAVYANEVIDSSLTMMMNEKIGNGSIATNSKIKEDFVRSRLIAEENLHALGREGLINLRIGRLFSFIGKHLKAKPQYAINAFVNMAAKGEIVISGNPNTTRGYLGSFDMSEWIYKSLSLDVNNGTFNIGSSTPVTMWEMANFIGSKFGARVQIQALNSEVDYYLADNTDTLMQLQAKVTAEWQQLINDYLSV